MDGKEYLGDSKIKWEFIGEPPKEKNYTLRISDAAKKNLRISGLLKVYTQFALVAETESLPRTALRNVSHRRSHRTVAEKISKQGSFQQVNGKVQLHTTKVQFSPSGRREIHIPSSAPGKFKIYGELPTMELLDYTPRTFKKKPGGEKFGFNLNNALWLVTCATLAYKNEEMIWDVCRNVWDMESCLYFNNPETDTVGFGMYNENFLVICFKGTETLKDWMTNLKFVLIPGRFPERYTQQGLRVHQGFHTALSGVWDQITCFIDEAYAAHPNLRLYICGHSLGGALANLCFAFLTLSDTPRAVSAVYTIGQPRVGNRKFKHFLELTNPNTPYIRITNNSDIVPNLAAGQHVGTHVHINAAKSLAFNPRVWVKAVHEIQALHQGGKDLSYHGLDDHSSIVYLQIIEETWSRSFALNSKNTNFLSLAESTLLIIDMLMTSLQGVRRYKAQFRSMIAHVIKFKPIIDSLLDYTVLMLSEQETEAIDCLKKLNQLLAQVHQEVIIRLKEKSILVRRARHESEFNAKMKHIGSQMQIAVDGMHELLMLLNLSFSDDLAERFGFDIQRYDRKAFDIDLNSINYEQLSANTMATRRTKGHQADISLMIDSAEEIMDEGDLEEALQFLEHMPTTQNFQRYMSNEQKASLAFLTAKCHAKLKHHTEAMKALQEIAGLETETGDFTEDQDFAELKNDKEFNTIAATLSNFKKAPAEYEKKLKQNEIDVLCSLFDDYDKAGDGYLSSKQFNAMIDEIGVENLFFQLGWMSPKGVPQIFQIMNTIKTEYHGSVNLEIYLNLMATLLPSETQSIGSSAARREKLKQKGGTTALWDMFSNSPPSSPKDNRSVFAGGPNKIPKGSGEYRTGTPPNLTNKPSYMAGL